MPKKLIDPIIEMSEIDPLKKVNSITKSGKNCVSKTAKVY